MPTVSPALLVCLPLLATLPGAQNRERSPASPPAGPTDYLVPPVHTLRLMSFNVWVGGGNVSGGLQKIVAAIEAADADVVGFQESTSTAVWVAQELGWHSYMPTTGSVAVISRFPITQTFPPTQNAAGVGVRLQLGTRPPQDVIVWSCHLTAYPYGPYQACFESATVQQIIDTQNGTQLPEVQAILAAMVPELDRKDEVPVFLVGDFNTPSHLDWVASTSPQHCGYVVPYPVTLATSAAGFRDAYRSLFPDPATHPGNTWSPIFPFNADENAPEPQDRIDQVHFAGAHVEPVSTSEFVVGTPLTWPNHQGNDWPSDHAAVLAEFRVQPRDGMVLPRPELTLDRANYSVGEDIVASFTRGPGNARDWIGLYPTDEAPGLFSSTAWFYTNSSQSAGNGSGPPQGDVTFDATSAPTWPLPPGSYNAYFLCCDGYAVAAGPVPFVIQ